MDRYTGSVAHPAAAHRLATMTIQHVGTGLPSPFYMEQATTIHIAV